jgi:eukaryotic-like serine/threonine-protein kinase
MRYEAAGSGTIGTLYRGKHLTLGTDVAIKEVKDIFTYFSFLKRNDVITRLGEELGAAATLNHPCILGILDMNLEISHPYYVMEYAQRGNLRQYRTSRSGFGPEEALIYFLQACYGLRHAHAAGLVHQNLKPENLLVTAQGNVKLCDFGMNRVIKNRTAGSTPRVFVGAIAYMAPELLAGDDHPDPGNDIYSLGIILYEMLTGNIPGRRSPLPSAVDKKIPAPVDRVFDRMTHDALDRRYRSMDEVLDDFFASFKEPTYGAKGRIVFRDEGPAKAAAE